MKRMCVTPLCVAVLLARGAASAQDNGSVQSGELARTGLNCNKQNSKLRQPVAQAQPVGKLAEVQTESAGGYGTHAAHDLETQEKAEVAASDSQVRPDPPGSLQPPEKEAVAILESGAEPARSLSGEDGLSAPPSRWK